MPDARPAPAHPDIILKDRFLKNPSKNKKHSSTEIFTKHAKSWGGVFDDNSDNCPAWIRLEGEKWP